MSSASVQQWCAKVQKTWNDASSPIARVPTLQAVGSAALKCLEKAYPNLPSTPSSSRSVILLGPPKTKGETLSIGLVLRDMLAEGDHNMYDFAKLRSADPKVSGSDILQDGKLLESETPWDASRTLFGALNIEATDDGLNRALLCATPFDERSDAIVDEGEWLSVYTHPSSITHPHLDYFGASIYVAHLGGSKLWFMWPATFSNLSLFQHYHEQFFTHDRLGLMLKTLKGLDVLLTDDSPQAFVIKPGTIHACITLTTSVHSTKQIWTYEHSEEALEAMSWGAHWIKNQAHNRVDVETLEGQLERLNVDIDKWDDVLRKNVENADVVQLEERLTLIKEDAEEVRVAIEVLMGLPSLEDC